MALSTVSKKDSKSSSEPVRSDASSNPFASEDFLLKKYLAENIHAIRDIYGLTQDQLGSMFGLKNGTISSYEKCGNTPNVFFLYHFSKIFNIPMDQLFDKDAFTLAPSVSVHKDSVGNAVSTLAYPISDLESNIFLRIHYLPKNQQKKLLNELSENMRKQFLDPDISVECSPEVDSDSDE